MFARDLGSKGPLALLAMVAVWSLPLLASGCAVPVDEGEGPSEDGALVDDDSTGAEVVDTTSDALSHTKKMTVTWYNIIPGQKTACGNLPVAGKRVAVGGALWDNGKGCGRTIAVRYPASSTVHRFLIDNRCPECGDHDVDLQRQGAWGLFKSTVKKPYEGKNWPAWDGLIPAYVTWHH